MSSPIFIQPVTSPSTIAKRIQLDRKNSSSSFSGSPSTRDSPHASRSGTYTRQHSNTNLPNLAEHFRDYEGLEDRSTTSGQKSKGVKLEFSFLVVQAVIFIMNLASFANPGITWPTSTQLKCYAWKFVTLPPRMLSNGWLALKWLGAMSKQRRPKLSGLKTKLKDYREGRREVNQAKAKALKELGIERDSQLDSKAAVKYFQRAARLDPSDVEIQIFRSKCLSDRVFEPEMLNTRKGKRLAEQAVRLSTKIVNKHPDLCLARIAHATNLGRLGIFSESKEKVKLAGMVKENALAALDIDPTHDLALHILGRWEFEMASLGPIVRALAKMLFADMGEGCMTRAAGCFQKAIDKEPTKLIHHVMLGKCLMKSNKEQAKASLVAAMELPVIDVNARNERADGVELLRKHFGITAPAPPANKPIPKEIPLPEQEVLTPKDEENSFVGRLSTVTMRAVSSCSNSNQTPNLVIATA